MSEPVYVRFACTSDWHGQLPPLNRIPHADALIIAGDICINGSAQAQAAWWNITFFRWIEDLRDSGRIGRVFLTWGNHDWVGQQRPDAIIPHPHVTILCDEGATYRGLRLYGTPWQPPFCNWAFNAPEEKLRSIFSRIPHNTDILIAHGPPKGFGDLTIEGNHVGSFALHEQLLRHPVANVITGHIHSAYGSYILNEATDVHNVSYLHENYRDTNPVISLYIPTKNSAHVSGLSDEIPPGLLVNGSAEATPAVL